MFEKFQSLELEKQELILNAVMKEFAEKGFKNASTNEIVTRAGISKGLLFHYFHNKKDLYLYVYDYVLNLLIHEFFDKIDWNERDIIARLRHCSRLKVDIIQRYPEMFDFSLAALQEDAPEVKHELEHKNKAVLTSHQARLLEGIDPSLFRTDVDIPKALQIILWTLEGMSNREKLRAPSTIMDAAYYARILEETDTYLNLLQKSFYR